MRKCSFSKLKIYLNECVASTFDFWCASLRLGKVNKLFISVVCLSCCIIPAGLTLADRSPISESFLKIKIKPVTNRMPSIFKAHKLKLLFAVHFNNATI